MNKLEQTVGKLLDDIEKSFPIRMQRAVEIVHRLKRHWEEFKITRFHSNNLKANIIDGPVASIPDTDAQERNTGLFLEICGLRALETDYQLTLVAAEVYDGPAPTPYENSAVKRSPLQSRTSTSAPISNQQLRR